jgi:hypothetical protein
MTAPAARDVQFQPAAWNDVVSALRVLPSLNAFVAERSSRIVELQSTRVTIHALAFEPLDDVVLAFVGVVTKRSEEPALHRLEGFVVHRESHGVHCMTIATFDSVCEGGDAGPSLRIDAVRIRELPVGVCVGALRGSAC